MPKNPKACQTCGMLLDDAAEFHPYAFCVWKKAGLDPWETLTWLNQGLGLDMTRLPKPPLISDLGQRMREKTHV